MALCFCAFTNKANAEIINYGRNVCSDGGTSGNNYVTATLDTSIGKLTISGTGNMADFDASSTGVPWVSYRSQITTIVIESGVTNIGNVAFENCANLFSATIPNTVTIIGNAAFKNCSSLTSIAIPNSVQTIEDYAFQNCSGLKAVGNLTTTPQNINSTVFQGVAVSNIYLATQKVAKATYQTANVWRNFKFVAPYMLIEGNIGDTFDAVIVGLDGNWYFYEYQNNNSNAPKRLAVYDGVENVVKFVTYFDNNGLPRKIVSDDGLSILADGYNGNQCNVTITTNDGQSQSYTGIETITDVNSTVSFWEKANITVGGLGCGLSVIDVIGNPSHWGKVTTVFGCLGHINDVQTSTGQDGFFPEKDAGLILFTNVLMTAVDCGLAAYTGNPYSWVQCVVGTAGIITTILSDKFDGTGINNCTNIGYRLSGGTLTISDNAAFSCSPYPWADRKSEITKLVIGSGVTSIPEAVFSNCSLLKDVTFEDGTVELSFGVSAERFENSPIETLYLGRNISYNYSYTKSPFSENAALKTVTVGNTVTYIGGKAFLNCTGLTSLTIGNSVTSVGEESFYGCSSLTTSLAFFQSLKTIGSSAFNGCKKLPSITIPNSVTSIGENAFSNCTLLKDVTFEDGAVELSFGVSAERFENSPIETLYLGRNISYNYSYTKSPFSENTALKTVTMGNTVTYIGGKAFLNCTGLTSVINHATTPQSINANVFSGVNISNIPLYVPTSSINFYQAANVWKDFFNIAGEITTTSINEKEVVIDWAAVPNAVNYTLSVYTDETQTQLFGTYNIPVSAAHSASVRSASENRLSYTVTGLSSNTPYYYNLVATGANNNTIVELSGDFVTQSSSGINEILAHDISVYPNPARNELFIKSEKLIDKVEILDISGRIVVATKATTVNIAHLPKGVYFAKIFVGNQIITKKIIKE
jgi:hypothetical protein